MPPGAEELPDALKILAKRNGKWHVDRSFEEHAESRLELIA